MSHVGIIEGPDPFAAVIRINVFAREARQGRAPENKAAVTDTPNSARIPDWQLQADGLQFVPEKQCLASIVSSHSFLHFQYVNLLKRSFWPTSPAQSWPLAGSKLKAPWISHS